MGIVFIHIRYQLRLCLYNSITTVVMVLLFELRMDVCCVGISPVVGAPAAVYHFQLTFSPDLH